MAGLLVLSGQGQSPSTVSGRTYVFLMLSGSAPGTSWLYYFRALKIGDAARVSILATAQIGWQVDFRPNAAGWQSTSARRQFDIDI